MTTAQCKIEIVKWCQLHLTFISNEFIPPLSPQQLISVCLIDNWKRNAKARDSINYFKKNKKMDNWERVFSCIAPGIDAQLRAYVITDPTDTSIISVEAHGE